MSSSFADWLARRTPEELADLLSRRPDALLGRPPATIGELAERLDHPDSLVAAARALTRPGLQLLNALRALGERRTEPALTTLLGGDDDPAVRAAVTSVLAELEAAGLARRADGGRVELPPALDELIPSPLGLDPPLRELWSDRTADQITRALRALGRRPGGRKGDSLELLLTALSDPELVRSVAARAPSTVAGELTRLARGAGEDGDGDGDGDEDPAGWYDPEAYRHAAEARRWGIEHGLLVGSTWGFDVAMPAEVALALKGPGWRAPFDHRPPEVAVQELPPERVESAAAAAVSGFAQAALAVLDRLARSPLPRLATGGVGVREVGRLGKELGIGEATVRLVLELASAAGVVEEGAEAVEPAPAFAAWRHARPAEQVAALIEAWWRFPGVPTESRDADDKALRALRRRDACEGCRASRVALLHVLRSLPPGAVSPREVGALVLWARPLVHVAPQDAGTPLVTVWREAELLGVVSAGALSPLGAVVPTDDPAALRNLLDRLLPGTSDSAAFGSDLTALVAGTPSARITELLDSCADRESSGGAVTWRFSPASVRRALDEGASHGELLDRLAAVSAKELPQPLRYLVEDVARRHGLLRISGAVSVITSEDVALLAEAVADRRLRPLGLRLLAPTVAGCAVPLDAALTRLRQAGYFPVAEGGPESARTEGAAAPAPPRGGATTTTLHDQAGGDRRPRAAAAPPAAAPPDPAELARALLVAPDTRPPRPRSRTGAALFRLAGDLTASEIDQLADALDSGGRVRIAYLSSAGAVTERVISGPELAGSNLYAWCELRQDERVFTVSRILSVAPAP